MFNNTSTFFGPTVTFSSVLLRFRAKGEQLIFMCSLYQCWPERKNVDLSSIKVLTLYHLLFIKNYLFHVNMRACFYSVIICCNIPHRNSSFHVCRPGSTGTGILSFSLIKVLMASTTLFGPTLGTTPRRVVKKMGSPRVSLDASRKSRCQGCS